MGEMRYNALACAVLFDAVLCKGTAAQAASDQSIAALVALALKRSKTAAARQGAVFARQGAIFARQGAIFVTLSRPVVRFPRHM